MDPQVIKEIEDKFNNEDFIDLSQPAKITISGNPDLEDFFLGEDEPLSTVLSSGVVSMRKGFYKVVGVPYYKTNISPKTFAAEVLYFRDTDKKMLKFVANIGPLTNKCAFYRGHLDDMADQKDRLVLQFKHDKAVDNPQEYFYEAKSKFYKRSYELGKIFLVTSCDFSQRENCIGYKEAHWVFLT